MYWSLCSINPASKVENHDSLSQAIGRVQGDAAQIDSSHGDYKPTLVERHSSMGTELVWEVLGAPDNTKTSHGVSIGQVGEV